jgi:Asp-tRNA(Asn)/Glu-tRNA(Gln) amidotransferase A subunit family amidase
MIAVDREDVLRQADEASQRIAAGKALSIFDGVPVAVKDELDMLPYHTKVGTAFLGQTPAQEDATIVARMRAAGALLIGKANMHEIGMGVTGLNTIHGTPRNPYGPDHYTGGSSSGPAAAVAAGLCPVALGADGGGSIRIPASFCGIVGLKPTFGRLSEHGAAPLCWSLAHVGPLAATVTDAAISYAVMAGPDPKDAVSLYQPAPTLAGWDREGLDGLTLGVYWPWFRHATAEVVTRCEAMLATFEELGATIREVTIPDLEAARVAHTMTVSAEMAQALSPTYAEHHREHGLDVRVNLALALRFTSLDYVQAQRVRTRLLANFGRVLKEVDVVLTPSTGLVAPPIPAAALRGGESDLSGLTEIMRFATPANLTGLPAISFPVGYNEAGLPVGMQAIARAWQEPTLLRLALAAENAVTRRAPQWHYSLLP